MTLETDRYCIKLEIRYLWNQLLSHFVGVLDKVEINSSNQRYGYYAAISSLIRASMMLRGY